MLSLPEGEDKPLKYPLVFRVADVCIISKIDLAPYLDVSISKIRDNVTKINPSLKVFEISTKTGEGISVWIAYLENHQILKK